MIEYATAVAIQIDGAIRFGVVAEIVETTDAKGTRKSYGVDLYDIDGDKHRHVQNDGDGIEELPSIEYTSYVDLENFVRNSPGYRWAKEESKRRKEEKRAAEEEERRAYIARREAERAAEEAV